MKIQIINYGLACRIGDIIYINKKLKNYPELYKQIMKHERKHSSGFDIRDLIIDLQGKYLKPVKKQYYKFILTNPSSWIQFLPIGIYDKKIAFDPIMILLWMEVFALICLIILI